MKYQLTDDEKKIENSADQLTPVSGEKRQRIEAILDSARKNQAINHPVSVFDLNMIKKRAEMEGLP